MLISSSSPIIITSHFVVCCTLFAGRETASRTPYPFLNRNLAPCCRKMNPEHLLECLGRAVNEIDALEAIYGAGDEENDDGTSFLVVSVSELETARSTVEEAECGVIPQLEVEVQTMLQSDDGIKVTLCLRCRLPPGYPEVPALVTVSVDGLRRAQREKLSSQLAAKAESMIGVEAVMELMEELKEIVPNYLANGQTAQGGSTTEQNSQAKKYPNTFGRRWIWVHHIKDSGRRKSIMYEARYLKLGGYLKSGYPGVIVVEGETSSCNEFVAWVKGNKSRPGGFGRNWGHHVRGEVNFPSGVRCLPSTFEELEDLAVLGGLCREHGLGDEFLEYVMQHKGSIG
jgi:hypothetical protein